MTWAFFAIIIFAICFGLSCLVGGFLASGSDEETTANSRWLRELEETETEGQDVFPDGVRHGRGQ